MARLPDTYGAKQVQDSVSKSAPDMRIRVPDTGFQNRASASVGAALMDAAEMINRDNLRAKAEAEAERKRLDDLRVEEAVNQLRSKQLELSHGDDGFSKVRGTNAVNRPTPLIDDYINRFGATINELEGSLVSDGQKAKFRDRAEALVLNYKGDLYKHASEQADQYKIDVVDGTVDIESQNAALNWFSPSAVNKAVGRMTQTIRDAFSDRPMEFVESKVQSALQKVNSSVVSNMLASGQVELAADFISKNVSSMGVNDVIKFNGKIKKVLDGRLIDSAVKDVLTAIPSKLIPNDLSMLTGLVRDAESGNRNYDSKGNLITSPKGALGNMQVLPGTAFDPGYGIRPIKKGLIGEEFAKELTRVGEEYLVAMIQKYSGDVPKALAAYNFGPGNLDKALAKADKEGVHWINHVPDETKKYVNKITSRYMSGENPNAEPTLSDVKKSVAERLKGQPQDIIDAAEKKAEAEFNDIRTSANQKSEDTVTSIMAKVDSGEISSYEQLTPEQLAVLGRNRTGIRSYIESANKRNAEDVGKSDVAIEFYYTMMEDPAKLKNSTVKDILELTPDLGQEKVNQLLNKRLQLRTQPESERAATVDADQFKAWAKKFGYGNSKDDKEKLIYIKEEVERTVDRIQNEEKRTLKREEKDKVIRGLMVEFPRVKAVYKGGIFGGRATEMKKAGYEIKDPRNIIIPDDVRSTLMLAYRAGGVPNPTESQLRDAYVDFLIAKGQE